MADDPNRDILPVREGSCADTCRSSIDPRERHFVYKLDRYELEDKYLRLLEEASNLKKLSNCQEDKIKRLATKLMRVTANPRACAVALDIYDDKNRIISLELENSKLKDKISVLRNQLLSHTITSRSSSRSRNLHARPSSGRITCRSGSSRSKVPSCHCIIETEDDDNHTQNNLDRIEKLEAQKKEMSHRIAQLENELSVCTASNEREKAAENVEYIKVWRQMKQLNDKLIATENTNKSLSAQINDLERKLEETTKSNHEITTALLAEKKRSSEIDEQILKAKDFQLSLREKDERIKDLTNEMKILQQHNSELIELSSKRGEVELENIELKKKISEQLHNQEILKTAFNTEQANMVALQTSNEQLLGKLQELQKNIDTLTVQLMSFQTQTEKQETSKATQISTKQANKPTVDKNELYKDAGSQIERCGKCDAYEKILQLEENKYIPRGCNNFTDKCVQTEYRIHLVTTNTKDQGTSVMTPVKEKPKKVEPQPVKEIERATATENPLTPEKMLKLLEQAQISTPLDQTRTTQKNVASNVDYDILDLNQRHRGTETLVQVSQESRAIQRKYQQQKSNKDTSTVQQLESQLMDPNKILSILFNILQEYSLTSSVPNGTLYHPAKCQSVKDINNNVDAKKDRTAKSPRSFAYRPLNITVASEHTPVLRAGCSMKKTCSTPYSKLRQEKFRRKVLSGVRKRNRPIKFAETSTCTCSNLMRCNANADCEHRCCNNDPVKSATAACTSNNTDMQYGARLTTKDALESNFFDPAQNYSSRSVSVTQLTRKLQDEGDGDIYARLEKREFVPKEDASEDDKALQEYVEQLDKCKEFVNYSLDNAAGIPVKKIVDHADISNAIRYRGLNKGLVSETEKVESFCSLNCPNECIDPSNPMADSFPLIIGDGQGLVELHIVSLQLSTSAKQILFRENDIGNVSLFVSWDIWNQEMAYTPTLKCPKLNFNSSFVYRIPDLFSFFNYVLLEFVIFQVNVFHEDTDSYVVARGKLCIKDILDYPQNKLHYIAPVNSVIPCSLGMNFGQLSLWVRLSCDIEQVEAFKKKRGIHTEQLYYRESVDEHTLEAEAPEKKDSPMKNGLLVLKETDSKGQLNYEPSKELLSKVTPYAEESSDTSDMPGISVRSTYSKVPLAIVKESEEESAHLQSSLEKVGQALRAQKLLEMDESAKSENEPRPRHHFKNSFKPKGSAHNEIRDMDSEIHKPSIAEFNDIISNEKQGDVTQDGSDASISEVTNVISKKNWEEYKQRSLLTFSSALSN